MTCAGCGLEKRKKHHHKKRKSRSRSSSPTRRVKVVVREKRRRSRSRSHSRSRSRSSSRSSSRSRSRSSSSCNSCDTACSGDSVFEWKTGCSSVSSSSCSGDSLYSELVKSSYDECTRSSSSSSSSSSRPILQRFCCCEQQKKWRKKHDRKHGRSRSRSPTRSSSTSVDESSTVYRKDHKKKHHSKSQKKEYIVSSVEIEGRNVIHIARIGAKEGNIRPLLRFRLGSTYSFRVECDEGMMFTTHAYGGASSDAYPLAGTRHAFRGEVLTFTATANHPSRFYYGSMKAEYMGGSVEIY